MTLGLTSLHPHAVVPSLLSDEGKRIVLPAFFQRGRDAPDKTRQTLNHGAPRRTDTPTQLALGGVTCALNTGTQTQLGVSARSADFLWANACAWLLRSLGGADAPA